MKSTSGPPQPKPVPKVEIKAENKTNADIELNNSVASVKKSKIDSLNGSINKIDNLCRICFCEGGEEDNPLITPCNCSGTMKYIHLQCLQQWLKTKLHTRVTGSCISILWKVLECELCKKTFPSKILQCF
jgi:hypothetical protein